MKHCLCLVPMLILLDLQKRFEIETNSLYYDVGAILIQHEHMISYHK
jgi:hypothetical protein